MTRLRRSSASLETLVLNLLAHAAEPLSAYALSRSAAASGQPLRPNQIYRTLARLTADGRVQRLETLACYQLGRENAEASVMCRACNRVECLPAADVLAGLGQWAAHFSFTPRQVVVEAHGLCHQCQARPPA